MAFLSCHSRARGAARLCRAFQRCGPGRQEGLDSHYRWPGMERYANWSPDGNMLYFLSERDGFRCIRGQHLDPATKHPVGPLFDVYHFHHARQSSGNGDPVFISPAVAQDKMVFGMIETTGTIWMATLDRR